MAAFRDRSAGRQGSCDVEHAPARLRVAALESLKAAETRKTDDFGPASESIDNACENCHLKFWYPEQEKLLQNAPRPK